jgi:hypothetical protein
MLGWGILALIAWILIAIWPARVAASKGHSFIGWFILSLFFWWITLFVAYSLKDPNRTPQRVEADAAADRQLEREEKGV